MSGIDLYTVFAADPNRPGAVVANRIQQQINSTDSQGWDVEKKELADHVVAIFADESRKQRYDQVLQSPFSPPEVTADFLAGLTTTKDSHGLNVLGQGGVDAPRDHSAVGDVTPAVSSEFHNSVIMRTVTTMSAPVQSLTPEATLKDVWARIPKTIQITIMTLAGLTVFWIGDEVFTLVQSLEYPESPWFMFLKVVINVFSRVAVLEITVMALVSGFTSSRIYRRLETGLSLTAALVLGLSLINDTMIFAVDIPFFVFDYHFGFCYWWEFTCYLVLSILAPILYLLP